MQNDYGDNLNNGLKNTAKQAGRRVGNEVKNRVKKAVKDKIKKKVNGAVVRQAIQKLILFLVHFGPWILLGIFALILLIQLVHIDVESTGTDNNVTQDANHQNDMAYDENGLLQAVAMVEPQAMKDAYYKYMACQSYRKLVVIGSEEIWLEFNYDDPDMYQDFAGMTDANNAEDQYFLSSEFILYADRMLHKDNFYFPEQVIKPVKWEMNDEGFVTAMPLSDDERVLTAESFVYEPDASVPDEQYVKKSDTNKDTGVWDYGFGTILQYEPFTIDKQIAYTIESIDVEEVALNADGTVQTDANGLPVMVIREKQPLDTLVKSPVFVNATYVMNEDGSYALDADNNLIVDVPAHYEYEEVLASTFIPSTVVASGTLTNLPLSPEHVLAGRREFNNATLNASFGNGGKTTYPIVVPVVKSAATLSGNVKYTYDTSLKETALTDATSDDIYSDAMHIQYKIAESNQSVKLAYHRTGTVNESSPEMATREEEPWGFDYIEDYTMHYMSYPPEDITQDLNFETRMSEELTDFLKKLGLLVPYGAASGQYNPWAPCGLSADELNTIIDRYLNGYTGNSLKGMGQALLDMEATHEVNALFALAVATQEQRMGKSDNVHTHNNNFFSFVGSGTGGYWESPSGRHWAVWNSPEDAIDAFGNNLRNKFNYYGRTIFGIGQIYCPNSEVAGQANGWAAGAMKLMNQFMGYLGQSMDVDPDTEYQIEESGELYIEGMEPSGNPGEQKHADDVVIKNNNGYPMYKIRAFDVRAATSVMQKTVAPKEENQGLFEAIGTLLGEAWESFTSILDQIKKVGESLKKVFVPVDPDDTKKHVYYKNYLDEEHSHMIVWQTYAACQAKDIESVRDELAQADPRSIFLFVGKIAGGSSSSIFGASMIPSTATKIEGADSPTGNYYPVSVPFDAAKGGEERAVPFGTPILAIADGKVTAVDTDSSITIEYTINGKTYTTTYGNLSSTMGLSVGDSVTKGQVVGKSGKAADGSDSLFFGVTENGRVMDPSTLFYQPSPSGGVGFYNLLNPDGTANTDSMNQLAKMMLEANWFYKEGSNERVTDFNNAGWIKCSALSSCESGGWQSGKEMHFDKWHCKPINRLQPWQCTWWANGRASEYLEAHGTKYKQYPTQAGNGGDYYDKAVAGGWFKTSKTVPHAPGLVSWKEPGNYGHVAFVEAVLPNGNIVISEAGGGVWWRGVRVVDPNHYSDYILSGYVYLDQEL